MFLKSPTIRLHECSFCAREPLRHRTVASGIAAHASAFRWNNTVLFHLIFKINE